MDDPIIRTDGVKKHFGGEKGIWDTITRNDPDPVRAVDGVSIEVQEGDILGIAGESGCGKTTLGKLLVNLHEPTEGNVHFEGQTFAEMDAEDRRDFRKRVQMIFQDPFESLNPRFTVMDAVVEPLKINDIGDSYEERRERVIGALEDAGLEPAENYLDQFPRNLSGGEQQRVAIARALVVDPDVIVADEPVSMLDVSIRAGVLNLMKELRQEYDLTYIFISHDLSLIRYMCDRTMIMYLGDVAEIGETEQVITDPKHPYTEALLNAVPVPEPNAGRNRTTLQGDIPSPEDPPSGCKFHPRCPEVIPPTDLDIDQSAYSDIVGLQSTIKEEDLGVEDAWIRVEEEHGADVDRDEHVDECVDYLYDEYLDEELPSDHESNVREALQNAARKRWSEAADILDSEYSGICQSVVPSQRTVEGSDHQVSCHLYDPDDPEEAVAEEFETDQATVDAD